MEIKVSMRSNQCSKNRPRQRLGAGLLPVAGINSKSGAKSGQGLGGRRDALGGLGWRLSGLGGPGISVCSVFKNADQLHSSLSRFLVHGLAKTKG